MLEELVKKTADREKALKLNINNPMHNVFFHFHSKLVVLK